MIVNDVAHLMNSPFMVRRKEDGATLYESTWENDDIRPEVAVLEVLSVRCVDLSLYPVVIFDV